MKDYSYSELKNYIVEDFGEFITQWGYNVDQTCARIVDEYHRAISNSESQKAVIFTCMANLSKKKGAIPEMVMDEISKIRAVFSREHYSEMTDEEFIMFEEELKKI